MDDARIAVETGVDGVDVVIGTSSYLMEHSHGKDMTYITNTAIEVINFVKSRNIEIRFSSEDSFRSNLVDLLSIYSTVDKIGVNRVGIADTVGCASPRQVYDLVRTLRGVVSCDIETHFHNDTGYGLPKLLGVYGVTLTLALAVAQLPTPTVPWRLERLTSTLRSSVSVSGMASPLWAV
jgi:isopropylmalate/homocitrate/citramalate synthase